MVSAHQFANLGSDQVREKVTTFISCSYALVQPKDCNLWAQRTMLQTWAQFGFLRNLSFLFLLLLSSSARAMQLMGSAYKVANLGYTLVHYYAQFLVLFPRSGSAQPMHIMRLAHHVAHLGKDRVLEESEFSCFAPTC